jgi:geranylgeranyl pyrophosphate synthase
LQLESHIPLSVLENVSLLDLKVRYAGESVAIKELLDNTVLEGGKRFRPLLTFLMGTLFNINWEVLAPYARAIELVHSASLSHDDVIDNGTTRRGLPSINIVGSNKKAVLAGDYLLADVIYELCQLDRPELVAELSTVIKSLALGEWLQVENAEKNHLKFSDIEQVALNKTSSVISWCCVAPAMLSRTDASVIQAAREMGVAIGLAFQYVDDVLDFSSSEITGKDEDKDQSNGVINSVYFELLERHPELLASFRMPSEVKKAASLPETSRDYAINKTMERAKEQVALAKERLNFIFLSDQTNTDTRLEAQQALIFLLDNLITRKF